MVDKPRSRAAGNRTEGGDGRGGRTGERMGEEGGGGDPAAKLRGTVAIRSRDRHGLHGREGRAMGVVDVKNKDKA